MHKIKIVGWETPEYGPGGETTDGCPAGYSKHPLTKECIPNGWVQQKQNGPTVSNAAKMNKNITNANVTKTCPAGYYKNAEGKCVKTYVPSFTMPANVASSTGVNKAYNTPLINLKTDDVDQSLTEGIIGSDNFLKSWYKGRVNDPRYGKTAQKRIDEIPKIKENIVSEKDLNNINAAGFYMPGTKEININPFDNYSRSATTQTHEKLHELYEQVPQINQDAIIKSLIVPKKGWITPRPDIDPKEYGYNYFSNPTEVAARLQVFRRRYGLNPRKKYSASEMQKIINNFNSMQNDYFNWNVNQQSGDSNIKELFNIIGNDPKRLAKMNDEIVMNQSQPQTTAAYGGPMVNYMAGKMNHGEMFNYGGELTPEELASLNRAKMKSKMALASAFGNPSAKRMTSVSPSSYRFTGNEMIGGRPTGVRPGETGTHFMSSMGNYAVPFIQQDANGKMIFNPNASFRDKEAMRFDNPEDARYFAEHYKEVAPMMQNYKNGGIAKYKTGGQKCPEGFINIDGECIKLDSQEYIDMLDKGQVGTFEGDRFWGNKATMQPLVVYNSKDKDTQNFFNKLKENNPDAYESLIELQKRYGHPHVSLKDKPSFFDPRSPNDSEKMRAHYNANDQRMYLQDGNSSYKLIEDYLAELSHQKQVLDKGPLDFNLRGLSGFGRTAGNMIMNFESPTDAYEREYDTPGNLEYQAHEEIQPKLEDEYYDILSDELDKYYHYKSPGSFPFLKPTSTYKNGGQFKDGGGITKYKQGGVTSNEGYYNVGMGVPRFDDGGSTQCPTGMYWDALLKKCVARPALFITSDFDEYSRRQQLASDSTNSAVNSRFNIETANNNSTTGNTVTNSNVLPLLNITDKSYKDKSKVAKRVTKYKKEPSKRYTTDQYKEKLIKDGNNLKAANEFVDQSASVITGDQIINPVAITDYSIDGKDYDEKGNLIANSNYQYIPEFQEAKQEVKYVEAPEAPPKYTITYSSPDGKQHTFPYIQDYDTWKQMKDRFAGSRAFVSSQEKGDKSEASFLLSGLTEEAFNKLLDEEYVEGNTKPINNLFNSQPSSSEASLKYQEANNKKFGGALSRFTKGGIPDPCYDEKGYLIPCPVENIHMNFLTDENEYIERLKDRQRNQNAMNLISARNKFLRDSFKNKPVVKAKEFSDVMGQFWNAIPEDEVDDFIEEQESKYFKQVPYRNKRNFITLIKDTKKEADKYDETKGFINSNGNPAGIYDPQYIDPNPERYRLMPKKIEYKTASPFNPQIIPRTFPKLEIPKVNLSGPYMVGYQDWETGQGVDRGFATAEERDAFYKQLGERNANDNVNLNSDISSYYDASKIKKKAYGGPGPKKPFFPVNNFTEPNYVAGQNPKGHYGYSDNTIWYDPNSEIENVNNPWWVGHEQYHHYQKLSGKNKQGQRNAELDAKVDDMIKANPELQFVPRSKLIEGSKSFPGAEVRMYEDPNTVEGGARAYEQYIENGGKSIFPKGNNNSRNNYPTESAPLRKGVEFKNGGDISIPQLPRQNSPLLQFYYGKVGGQTPRNLMDSMVKPQKKRKLD